MNWLIPRLALSAALIVALHSSTALAQPVLSIIPTAEWLEAQAEVIVRVSIAEVGRESLSNGSGWGTVTVRVHEALKGSPATSLAVAQFFYAEDPRYDQWKDSGQEQLWFLVPNEQYKKNDPAAPPESRYPLRCGHVIPLGSPVPAEKNFVSPVCYLLSMDLTVRRDPKEILGAIRSIVSQRRGKKTSQSENVGVNLPATNLPSAGLYWVQMTVPVDERLEKFAQKWIQENSSRVDGIRALAYFRSAKNIRLLKSLLDDPGYSFVSPNDQRETRVQLKEYTIRKEAYAALAAWGVRVPQPIVAEWVPMDRVYQKKDLAEYGDTAGGKTRYYFARGYTPIGDDRMRPWLYRSDDGGETWRLWCVAFDFKEFFMHPETEMLYAVVDSLANTTDAEGFLRPHSAGEKVIMSVDGQHWKDLTPGRSALMHVARLISDPDHPRRICVEGGFSTGFNGGAIARFVLQSVDDEYSKWKWYAASDWDKRKQAAPLHTE